MNENATMNTDVIEELSIRYLLFRIHEAYYGLSLTSVREIIQVPKITDIPGTPEYVKGIINLRGGVVPVIDVRLKFAMPEREYDSQISRYREILGGASFSFDEDILPTRADIADVYRFFRYENMSGHTSFTYRMLRSQLFEHLRINASYSKLRFAISILGDINVCGVREDSDDIVSVEVYKNAEKTNIELSETYKRLCSQCGA